MTHDPVHTITNAKRFIGRPWTAEVANQALEYDYHVMADPETGESCFKLSLTGHPPCVSPIYVGQLIVQYLQTMAQVYLKHDKIDTVVACVPADFNKAQRKSTSQVFARAQLAVARVLDEPTAAAVAYGLHVDPQVNYVLVFDFGGGTLDVSLLYIHQESVTVLGMAGDNQLGGEDLDHQVYLHLKQLFQTQLGTDLIVQEKTVSSLAHATYFPCTTSGVRREAERVKRQLSSQLSTTASCVYHAVDEQGEVRQHLVTTTDISRHTFETSLCRVLLTRAMSVVSQVLIDVVMAPSQVDEVVLVGGSSRIPWLSTQLTTMFGKPPQSTIDPDLAVATGAARIVD